MTQDLIGWREFFNEHAPHYMENVYVHNTVAEVDFLLEELRPRSQPGEALAPGSSVLDIGCGTGRHAVELARRGYRVTGVDLSAGMLAQARRAAVEAGVAVEFIEADATRYRADRTFDAAVCLCEGAFGLFGRDEDPMQHDMAILHNIAAALGLGARFVMTTMNGFARIRELRQESVDDGRFDP